MNEKKFKKKRVYRLGVPETNSSSSHSCCINFNKLSEAKPGDQEYDIVIKDGILFVSEPTVSFGTNIYKTNSCLIKLQYVCGLLCCGELYSGSYQKDLYKLKTILMKIFNVRDVRFSWVEDIFLNGKGGKLGEYEEEGVYVGGISIDHQSIDDMRDEICESEETIRSFILNKTSWLYIAPDGGVSVKGFYKELYTEPEKSFVLSVEFGRNLGRVDAVIENISDVFSIRHCDPLSYIFYDKNKDKFIAGEGRFYECPGYSEADKDELFCISDYCENSIILEDGKYYLVLVKGDVIEEIIKEEIDKKSSKPISSVIGSGKHPLSDIDGGIQALMDKYPDRIEIMKFPVSLWSSEFGKLF